MKGRIAAGVVLGLILVVVASLAGCKRPTPAPTPAPTRAVTTSPTSIPTPSVTPSPSPTPLPPQPPRVLRSAPERGEEQPVTAPVMLVFDQEMDTASLEKAFHIEPAVTGALSWDNPKTLRFTPAKDSLRRDTAYRVTVDTTAQSARKLSLVRPVDFRFQTVGFLEVTDVLPTSGSNAVGNDSPIRVVFNRPVVPLTSVDDQKSLVNPLEFTPAVQGKGTWVNTSIFSFQPSERLQPGITYKVRVRQGLEDTTGGLLAQDYTWSFTTELPDVRSVRPAHKAQFVSPLTSVRVTFNQPMKQGDTQSRFSLVPDKGQTAIPGLFAWDASTMIFTPTQDLSMGVTYRARLDKGSLGLTGQAGITQTYTWQFDVAGLPSVVGLTPREGASGVALGDGLEIVFSSPISQGSFLKGFSITPTAQVWPYWQDGDTRVRLSTYLKPSTSYTVTLSNDIVGRYGGRLPGRTLHFRTGPYAPMIQFNVPGMVGTYNAYATPKMFVWYRNVSRLDVALYTLSPDDLLAISREGGYSYWDKYRGQESALVRRWSLPVNAPLDATDLLSITLALPDGKALAPGFYYLEASSPQARQIERHALLLSDTNLTLKSTQTDAFVWATDLRDGTPVSGVEVSIYGAKGTRIAQTVTDKDGVAQAKIPQQDPWQPLIVMGKRGSGLAAVLRSWTNGIDPWSFNVTAAPYAEKYRGYFYTDRRIYRPGQKVYFKGLLRSDEDGRYSLPPTGAQVSLVATDGQGREFWQSNASVGDMGTVYGEFDLAENASLGYYSLQAKYAEQVFSTDFQVAEYRKPDFQVKVTLDKSEYIQGETIQAVAEASYFFGGPATGATVHWRVMRNPYYFSRWPGEDYYSFAEQEDSPQPFARDFGQFASEGEGETDAQGRFTFPVPANIADLKQSQTFVIEASVTDINNQEVSERGSAIVHKGSFYIGLAALSYVSTVGQESQVRAITVDTQGLTRTQQALEIVFYKHEWYSVQEKADDGQYYWTNKVRDTPVTTRTVKTDNVGQALVSFTPSEGGSYRVVATGRDERENMVRSSTYLWISDQQYVNWGQQNNDRINLVADKKSYRPGETAQILIPSPFQGTVTALLTIERGHILEYRLLQLKKNSEQISLPILAEYAPNVYVSVMIVKGMDKTNPMPGFKLGYVMLPVSTEQKELHIKITPDRSTAYGPREKVVYDVLATDYQGRGVEAEVSLQLVDLAVETLVGADNRDIVQEFYRQRGLGIATATGLVNSAERHNLEVLGEGKGGGGGGGDANMVRQFFPDTAFWAPTVRTDTSGKARVTVTLPDSLTTWRMTAQAVTAQTQVGKARVDIVTNLDVMVRPVTPRFMVIGDQPVLGAVLHNNTAESLVMTVNLEAQGLKITNAKQTVTVPAHDRKVVNWPVVVGALEKAALRFTASAGKYADAIDISLPVYHPSTAETVGTSGQVEDRIIELLRLPENVDSSLGELSLELDPSLAAGTRDSLEYLRAYPYDCIEQTVSRFLPNVATYRALRKLGVQDAELEAQLPQQVGVALQRLYALQGLDGGWGWWPSDASSPLLSAYVLLGLSEARRAQFSVDRQVFERGRDYLIEWLGLETREAQSQLDTRAAVLYALAEAGEGDMGRTVALYDKRSSLALYSKAYLAMALQILAPQEMSRLNTLASELANAAILSATEAHWEEAQFNSSWAMNTDTRTSAIVLRALVRVQPEHGLLPNAVRWLMTARKSGRWETTQENVWSLLALTDYMAATGELAADYSYSLMLNGQSQSSGSVSPTTVGQPIRSTIPVSALRLQADNDVIIERTVSSNQKGTGKLYYSAFLRYFLPAEKLPAVDRGIRVDRRYTLVGNPTKPISQAAVNDTVIVTLTLIAPHDLYFLVLEDPFPAGCEAVDTSLNTSSMATQSPEIVREADQLQTESLWRWYWPSHTEMRDEKVALFASHLARGTYEYAYTLRCTTPGQFKVMPATAYEMYAADVFGRSAGATFTVQGN